MGHSGEVVNKVHLYDRMMESSNPSSARQTLPILAKYSRMKRLLAEIHKVVPRVAPPSGYSIRVHPDLQPERCTRWSAKWRWCRLPRWGLDPVNWEEPPSPQVQEGLRIGKDPALWKDPFFPGSSEEHRVGLIRKRSVPCSGEDIGPIPDPG